jgi:hypothetical protein
MTTTGLEATTTERRKRPLVWPWAILCAGLFALLFPMVLALLGVPDRYYLAMTIACVPIGFLIALGLGRRPSLRIGLLAGSVLVAAAWAAWAYRTNMHWWRPDVGDDYLLPWGVSNVPAAAVVVQPIAVGACVVLAVVALVRLGRGRIERTGWWTAVLAVALIVCSSAALQTLLNRAYTA